MSDSKNVASSTTNQLGLSVILISAFNIYQDYSGTGISGINEADVALIISGLGIIINRLTDRYSKKLYFKKPNANIL